MGKMGKISGIDEASVISSASVIGAENRMKLLESRIFKLLKAQNAMLKEHEKQVESFEAELSDLNEKLELQKSAESNEGDSSKDKKIAALQNEVSTLKKMVSAKDQSIALLNKKIDAKQPAKQPAKQVSVTERRAQLAEKRKQIGVQQMA
uniref:Uncharacterized protein n=1 Tax=Thalassionema nitzschioides TaxID=33649 RepID=A0A6T5XZM5_9STRA|mmetsp:Transcript_4587/g.6614  ORF Transcript_4587/g.6614 Transcript_4587/m.6614 type:complete len:150 (-) Transcript_4587:141-590(-)|eukprot:CAMPEP_0194210552 /NCGR_PEP_ID=MMETSP0156-20130528/8727_1 /TAXON_ID=33649 /ORGANISM="Thalassionema nitzschioides, Strain L26-B" /LENGTH=149 /DNA_ID=CAMNT_0038937913 /DNA_START=61 /DNA_END=510 /DNA_ORIENTATION=-